MKGAVKLITIRGISLYAHWSFLLLLMWIILLNISVGNSVDRLAWSLAFVSAVFICITLHELGHAIVASRYGIKANNILLLPIGGVASIDKFPANPRQELAISVAGPAVNIIISGLLYFLVLRYEPVPDPAESYFNIGPHFLYNLYLANLGLATFNLIPAFPMDGGRIFRALLALKTNYINATNIAAYTGKIIAVAFIGLGIVFVNFILPLIGIFIIISADSEKYYLQIQSMVKGIKTKDMAILNYYDLNANLTVKEAAGILLSNFNKHFILTEDSRPVASINRIDIISALAAKKYDTRLKNLAKHEIICFDGNEEVETILEILARHENLQYPVTTNGNIIGVISFTQVIEYLLLHSPGSEKYVKVSSLARLLSY